MSDYKQQCSSNECKHEGNGHLKEIATNIIDMANKMILESNHEVTSGDVGYICELVCSSLWATCIDYLTDAYGKDSIELLVVIETIKERIYYKALMLVYERLKSEESTN